jgi:isopentenyl-diphosphate delta-isomerase
VTDLTAVSCPSEELILVDANDQVVGYGAKGAIHRDGGQRHRAFSVFLFDDSGCMLVHRRSHHKPLWPGFWTNSCCSHPRRGESLDESVQRRVREELGCEFRAIEHAFAFEYHAEDRDATGERRGSEHELCHVFLARIDPRTRIRVHELEIAEYQWLTADQIDALVRDVPETLTPWFRQEWSALRGTYAAILRSFLKPSEGGLTQGAELDTA